MVTVEAELSLPVVRMCDNPDCGGWDDCDRIGRTRPSMGFSIATGTGAVLGDAMLCAMAADTIARAYATDGTGTRHVIPGTAEFTVHRGRDRCAVVYSGAQDRDGLLAAAPVYEDDEEESA